MSETLSFDNSLNEIAGFVNFFLILDNSGNRIYCNYYTNDNNLNTIEKQLEFEKKLCQMTMTYSVDKSDIDIFIFDKYNILSRISAETAIFIGQNENDNELLLQEIYNVFESILLNIIQDSLSREKMLNNYEKIALLIDEMINGGIVINLDEKSLNNRINEGNKSSKTGTKNSSNTDNNNKSENTSKSDSNNEKKGGILNGWFGFWK